MTVWHLESKKPFEFSGEPKTKFEWTRKLNNQNNVFETMFCSLFGGRKQRCVGRLFRHIKYLLCKKQHDFHEIMFCKFLSLSQSGSFAKATLFHDNSLQMTTSLLRDVKTASNSTSKFWKIVCKGEKVCTRGCISSSAWYKLSFEPSTNSVRFVLFLYYKYM